MPTRRKQAFAEHLIDRMTWPEKILWSRLRHKHLGYSFQRQHIIGEYIVDFWCPTAQLVVELDGSAHDLPTGLAHDKKRDEFIRGLGIEILRFKNKDVYRGMSAVLLRIYEACDRRAEIKLSPFRKGANPSRRHEDSVEFAAVREFKQRKYEERALSAFAQRYRAKREEKRRAKAKGPLRAAAVRANGDSISTTPRTP